MGGQNVRKRGFEETRLMIIKVNVLILSKPVLYILPTKYILKHCRTRDEESLF